MSIIKINKEKGKDNNESLENILKPVDIENVNNGYYIPEKLKEEFDDLKTTIQGIEDFGSEMGARTYLFTGPPGTGKTLAVKSLSKEMNMSLYDISSLIKGQSTNVEAIFENLRKIAESSEKGILVVIDEVEGLSSREEITDPMQLQAFSQVLSQMDGTNKNKGIFIIGTSNRPNDLDEAIRSRFAQDIEFFPPDLNGRYEILKIHANGKGNHKFSVNEDYLRIIADSTRGYVGRDLQQLLSKVFVHAKRKNRTEISKEDIDYGIGKIKPSAIRDMSFIEPKITFKDIIGYSMHKSLATNIIKNNPKGSTILLYGPSGTGKTMFVEALAGNEKYNLIMIKGSELENKWVGETIKNIEKIIKRAKLLGPCILCFDEISSFIQREDYVGHKDTQTGYIKSVLSKPVEGVHIIATDNDANFLRESFVRNRFAHKFYFRMPKEQEQAQMWQIYGNMNRKNAYQIISATRSLSGKEIFDISQKIKDFGGCKTDYSFIQEMINRTERDETEVYDGLAKKIGDSVEDYKTMLQMRSKNGKQ